MNKQNNECIIKIKFDVQILKRKDKYGWILKPKLRVFSRSTNFGWFKAWAKLMRTLVEFNGIHDPKINLTQVCWDLN
jgi:hypothetical protein